MLGVLLTPGVSLALGLVVFVVVRIVSRRRAAHAPTGDGRQRLLHSLSLFAPWAIIAPFVVIEALPFVYLIAWYAGIETASPNEDRWFWIFSAPPVVATLCVALALVAISREKVVIEVPVAPVVRRGWSSFSRTRDLTIAAATFAVLAVTVVVAGSASTPNESGWYTRGEDTGGGTMTFFGWAFGIPALASVGVLALVLWAALTVNASRPFVRPETVSDESEARRRTAALLTRLVVATALLVLGAAWSLIGGAGSGSSGVTIPGVGEFTFYSGYASFAPAFIVIGVALQTCAVVLLLLTLPGRRKHAPVVEKAAVAEVSA